MRDHFRDWNLYHKSIVAGLAAVVFGILLHAVLVYDTAFEINDERMINADAETVWAWISDDKNRSRWQAELHDLVPLTGETAETDTTRLVFWQRGLRRWQSTERTTNIITGRILNLLQQSDTDKRWITLSLELVSRCQTRLIVTEIIEPNAYKDRFWFFNERALHEARLEASFEAMNRWMRSAAPDCTAPQENALKD